MSQIAGENETPRDKLADDPHRPLYHFLPESNWMNDPNGLIQWDGLYHLFYQYNPNGPFHGTIHWGHAVSEDLVHWADLPPALAPTHGGPDEDGCWSGCAVDNDGVPTLVYTGVRGGDRREEGTCIATSSDGLLTWKKHPGNPVIASPPQGLDVLGFRDPYVWKEGKTWYHLVGSGIEGVGGTALLYESEDLIHWDYINPIYTRSESATDPVWTGQMWECPQLFPLGGEHILMVSVWENDVLYHAAYFAGTYADHKLTPRATRRLDLGADYYAPYTMLDDKGRRIIWGWSWEARSSEAQRAAGWAGVMSLPRILSPRPDGLLGIEPVPELRALRGAHQRLTDVTLTPASPNVLRDVRGDCLEIIAEFEPQDAREFGLRVRCSPGGQEQTHIVYDRVTERLAVDREHASLDPEAHGGVHGGSLELAEGEHPTLHVFLDRSIVEVYANGRASITERIYPSRPDSLSVDLFASDGKAKLKSMDVWEMKPAWRIGDE
jgi:beta-fructofuranosidase